MSVHDPDPVASVALFTNCMDFDTVFASSAADSGLAVFGRFLFKLPTLSIKERFAGPWLCVDLA